MPFLRRTDSFPVGVDEISNALDSERVWGMCPFFKHKGQLRRQSECVQEEKNAHY